MDIISNIKWNNLKLRISSVLIILLFTQTLMFSILNDNPIVNESMKTSGAFFTSLNKNYTNQIMALDGSIRDSIPSINTDPIIEISGSGDDFTVEEELLVYHPEAVSLNSDNSYTDSYTISDLSEYTIESLQYNITSISTSQEFVIQQTLHNKDEILASNNIRIAQSFDVTTDYAVFSGAKLYLLIENIIGSDELELFLVRASIVDGKPDMGTILSNATNGPFNSGNPITESTPGSPVYYDFYDTVLSAGTYYVIANLSTYDLNNGDGFNWRGQQGSVFASSYIHDGTTWSGIINKDYILAPELMQCDSMGSPITFSDPASVQLRDNTVAITSLNQLIIGTGSHELTSNITIDVNMNNTYSFSRSFIGSSSFTAVNSSFYDFSISWNVSWISSSVDIAPYSNPIRTQILTIPETWDETMFTLLLNGLVPSDYNYESRIFIIDLAELLIGSVYSEGHFYLQTASRNLLYDLSQSESIFNLGYWETDGVNATGFQGSSIDSIVTVRESITTEVINGNLNFTIFNPDGVIIPLKTSLPANLIYLDTSFYSQLITTQSGPGEYSASSSFDPSVYGSDVEGYWTAVYLWENGTDVGMISKILTVVKPTLAEFEWEVSEGSDIWTNDTLLTIDRIDGEGLRVRVRYLNISDPFFSDIGTLIPSAYVTYETSWLDSGLIPFDESEYTYEIPVHGPASLFTIDLKTEGFFLENHTIHFSLNILHVFQVNKEQNDYYSNFTNDFIIRFEVIDLSNSNTFIEPDTFQLKVEETVLQLSNYQQDYSNGEVVLTIISDDLSLGVGTHALSLNISKSNYVDLIGSETLQINFNLNVLAIDTEIEIIEPVEELESNSQTTLKFRYIDTNHSTPIRGANIDVRVDIENVEVWLDPEDNGVYSIVIKTQEPTVLSLNIFIDISKEGYETQLDFRFPGITIVPVEPTLPPGEIPFYIYIIAGIIGAGLLIVPVILTVRRKIKKGRSFQKTQFTNIYRFYEGILSITKLIIVHNTTSLPVYEMDLGSDIRVDPSLITGFLGAISTVGGEIKGDKQASVKRVEYRDFQVLANRSGQFTIYTFSEAELNKEIEKKLTVISDWFAIMFSSITDDWDGSTEPFRMNLQGITEKIMKEIHLWIFYPFRVSPNKLVEVERMSGLRKKLVNYVQDQENITISRLFDDFDDIKLEQGLPIIFDLIEKNILEPEFDAYKIATVRF